jgi:hypothetical protein
MATATATPLRPTRGSNFTSKSDRKRIRKSMVRAYVSNKVADAKNAHAERVEFYRNLRRIKQYRLDISKEFFVLESMVGAAASKAATAQTLVDAVKATTPAQKKIVKDLWDSVDETVSAGQSAAKAVGGVAVEFRAFATRRVYFTERS